MGNRADSLEHSDGAYWLIFFFIFSFFLQILSFKLRIDLKPLLPLAFDFHVKPFMIFALILTPFFIVKLKLLRLKNHEVFFLIFYLYFMCTILVAEHKDISLKLIAGSLIMLYIYFISRRLFYETDISLLDTVIPTLGYIFNFLAIALYIAVLTFWKRGTIAGIRFLPYAAVGGEGIPRLTGSIYGPNYFVLFNSIFFFYYLSHLKKRINTLGLFVTAITTLLTFSIGGIGAIFIAFLINFFLEKDRKLLLRIVIYLVIVMFLFALLYFAFLRNTSFLSQRLWSIKTGSYRYEMWGFALSLFKKNPLFGIGMYNFRYYSTTLFKISNMHNTLLKVLVEGGIIGFVLFCAFNVLVLKKLYKIMRYDDSARYLFLTYIAILGIFASLEALIHEFYFFILALSSRYIYEYDFYLVNRKGKRYDAS